MKKSRLIVLLSLVLCVATLFAACGKGGPELEDIYNMDEIAYEDENIVPTKAEALTDYAGASATALGNGKIVKFVEGSTIALYDVVANKKIWTATETETVTYPTITPLVLDADNEIFCVVEKTKGAEEDTYKTILLDQTGAQIATADKQAAPTLMLDLINFDKVLYRIADDGKIAKAFDYNTVAGMPTVKSYNGTYYYGDVSKSITVYDANLKLVAAYQYPSYANSVTAFVTNEGNIMFQYSIQLPDDAVDYTYLNGTKKMQLVSGLYDVEKMEVEELDLEYQIVAGISRSVKSAYGVATMDEYIEKYEQIVMAYDIVDERINTTTAAVKLYAVNGEGKVKATINELIMAQGLNEPVAVAPNRYTVKNYLNQTILLNEKGEEIGDVSKVETFKKSYMVVDGKLFNYDLKMIYDYKEAELAQYKLYDNCAIFMNEDGEYFLFKDGAATKIIEKPAEGATTFKSITANDNYYVITVVTVGENETVTTYEYYNVNGVKIDVPSQKFVELISTYDGYVLARGLDKDGKNVFYRFS